jgi:hypothetical protein
MTELNGRTVAIVVANEINQFVWSLQEEVERMGAKTTVAFGPPDTTDVVAAIVSAEQQAVVPTLKLPVVVYYEGDTPEQIVARLRRVLRLPAPSENYGAQSSASASETPADAAPPRRWSTRRGMVTLVVLLFLLSLAAAAGVRFLLIYAFGWE